MKEKYYYCWSCGQKFSYPTYAKNCRDCNNLFMQDRERINTTCRMCNKPKEHNKYPLCYDCYELVREKNMKGY